MEKAFCNFKSNASQANLIMVKKRRAEARRTIRQQKRQFWKRFISKINDTPLSKVRKLLCRKIPIFTKRDSPFGIRVQQLLLEIDLDTNSIEEDKFSEIPPWTLERPGSILDLAALQKDKTPPEVYREKFEQIIENHSDHYLLFTDGSKDETCVGAACHSSSADKCCGVSAKASIFTAEAVALCMALDTVSTLRKDKFLILSDSLSLMRAMGEANPRNPRILKVLERIHDIYAFTTQRDKETPLLQV
ncbi:hypothetical protein EGW08_022316 [Elysia chlorotica]|uniref:Uncharacterized protein n=1 Tax=Elysia chlorotica TaxID=188477 RepID=A0A3S1BLJ6_ELYCH|nr:hypothetical protein EGW08_022316 [Elysia chlorotica]